MKTLIPPTITAPSAAPSPGWWSAEGDVAISRDELLAKWRVEVMTLRPPDTVAFAHEMGEWCSALHDVPWVAAEFGREAAESIRRAHSRYDGAPRWDAVSQVIAAYVEPLAEYTSGWGHSMWVRGPRVSAQVARELLTICRLAGQRIREDLRAREVQTALTLDAFICDQRGLQRRHTCVALSECIIRVQPVLEGLARLCRAEDNDMRLRLAEFYRDLVAAAEEGCDEPPARARTTDRAPSPSATPGRRRRSDVITTDRLAGRPSVLPDAADVEVRLILQRLRGDARIWIARDRTLRQPQSDEMWWEARLALALLDDAELVGNGIAAYVSAQWGDRPPGSARSRTLRQAIRDVELLVQNSINEAKRQGDS